MIGCIFSAVTSAQELYVDNDCMGAMQLLVAMSSVMPLGVGHVVLAWCPSGPGIDGSSTGGIASAGSRGPRPPPSTEDASRFFLILYSRKMQFYAGVTSNMR